MKKESSRIFVFLFITLLLISLIAAIVAAQNEAANQQTAAKEGKSILDLIKDAWNKSSFKFSDQSKNLLAKGLLLILVILIVYSIMSFMPFIPEDKDWIGWLIAIIIGILSFLFISADEVRNILTTYEALGVALTSIIPLIVILTFCYKMREKKPTIANITNPALLIMFLLWAGYKWITYRPSSGVIPETIWFYPATFVITVLWLIFERRIMRWLRKKDIIGAYEGEREDVKVALLGEVERRMRDRPRGLSSTALAAYDRKTEELRRRAEGPGS